MKNRPMLDHAETPPRAAVPHEHGGIHDPSQTHAKLGSGGIHGEGEAGSGDRA